MNQSNSLCDYYNLMIPSQLVFFNQDSCQVSLYCNDFTFLTLPNQHIYKHPRFQNHYHCIIFKETNYICKSTGKTIYISGQSIYDFFIHMLGHKVAICHLDAYA